MGLICRQENHDLLCCIQRIYQLSSKSVLLVCEEVLQRFQSVRLMLHYYLLLLIAHTRPHNLHYLKDIK